MKLVQLIKNWALKQERKAFMNMYGFDNQCPHCNTWQGNCGGVASTIRDYPDKRHDAYKCGSCKQWFILHADTPIQAVALDQKYGRLLTYVSQAEVGDSAPIRDFQMAEQALASVGEL
jgi:hypothetical protein